MPAALARRSLAKIFTRSCSLWCCGLWGSSTSAHGWDEESRVPGQRRTLQDVISNVRLYYGIAFGLSSIVNLLGLYGLWISDDKSYSNNIVLLMGNASLICIIVYIL
ncbi:hypothetical protein BDN72DRAFT_551603 [Pluteus cervinus]|uniref:Uncharacterized protein n=1 Tax=Pluteus cervinus TaxID=181527 RepID=A0ACD3AY01_9AGAR|nr:hypothetical protein BDN72DRAFT_551603 [Pluteus cervinus]